MIPREALPNISSVLSRLGIAPGRRSRCACPIHQGDNKYAFSYSDEKGSWFCFRCGFGGDAIELVKKTLDFGFSDALRWLGLEPGRIPKPDPAMLRKQRARAGLQSWASRTGKILRHEFYIRERIITRALARLRKDPEDAFGWNWLAWALVGQAALEYRLDMLAGKEPDQLAIYKAMRIAA